MEGLTIYWGYGMLAFAFGNPSSPLDGRDHSQACQKEKYALLLLCVVAAFLSSFMANPVVVIILAPLFIHISEKLKSNLFVYLVGLAVSSNVVTTVTMVSDPPALIVAAKTGMQFLDFYWFQGKVGLGTISVFGIIAAMLVLLYQFRRMNNSISGIEEAVAIKSHIPWIIFVVSVILLSLPIMTAGIPLVNQGTVGFLVGVGALLYNRKNARAMHERVRLGLDLLSRGDLHHHRHGGKGWPSQGLRRLDRLDGPEESTAYLFIFVWLSVLLSSFIDNVPYTVLMIPVCNYVATNLGVNPFVFYFGMLVGCGIGGNITPVGATANVLACGMLEKRGYKIDLMKYLSLSIPFSVMATAVPHLLLQFIWL
jgi:Na+/H+ antiporter NhaD/arsenite permease-like protein